MLYRKMNAKLVLFCIGIFHSTHQRSAVEAADVCKDDLTVSYATAATASSHFSPNDKTVNYGPDRAILNATETKDAAGVTQMGGWVAEKDNFNQWIQVEFKDASMVRGLVTQGRNGCCQQWVTRYRVLYSEDCKHWHTVPGFNVTDKFFKANTDENTPVTNMFECPVMAKCIRVNPLGWNKNIAMRLGILGCPLYLNGAPTSQATTSSLPQTTSTQPPTTTKTSTQPPTQSSTTTHAPTQTTTHAPTQTTTHAPTQTTTQPSATVKTNATPKSGGSVLNPNQGGKKGSCIKSCKGRANGDYQSCSGCEYYITCVWESLFDKRPCPKATFWDDNEKRCVLKSSTCP